MDELDLGETLSYDGGDGEAFNPFNPFSKPPQFGRMVVKEIMGRHQNPPIKTAIGRNYLPQAQSPIANMASRIREDVVANSAEIQDLKQQLVAATSKMAGVLKTADAQQSGDQFQYALTTAAVNITPAVKKGDWALVIAELLPVLQTVWAAKAAGLGASFRARPFSTIAYPVLVVVVLNWFRERLRQKPGTPSIAARLFQGLGKKKVDVTLNSSNGARIFYSTNGSVVTERDTLYLAPFQVGAGTQVRARAFVDGGIGSDEAVQQFTK